MISPPMTTIFKAINSVISVAHCQGLKSGMSTDYRTF